jgi:hypothetical protein
MNVEMVPCKQITTVAKREKKNDCWLLHLLKRLYHVMHILNLFAVLYCLAYLYVHTYIPT